MLKAEKPRFRIVDQKGTLYHPPKRIHGEPEDIARIRRKIRKAALKNGCIITHELPDEPFESEASRITFIDEYTKAIHQYMKDRDEAESILDIAKQENSASLGKVKGVLVSAGLFTPKAIEGAMEILERDLNRAMERTLKESKEVNYEWGFNQGKHAWKERSRKLIEEIHDIYIKRSPFGPDEAKKRGPNDYQIAHNMSLVFEAVGISPSGTDTLRKIFSAIRKGRQTVS
jgi:hypothetical protein